MSNYSEIKGCNCVCVCVIERIPLHAMIFTVPRNPRHTSPIHIICHPPLHDRVNHAEVFFLDFVMTNPLRVRNDTQNNGGDAWLDVWSPQVLESRSGAWVITV
jgi:hypothetical protein